MSAVVNLKLLSALSNLSYRSFEKYLDNLYGRINNANESNDAQHRLIAPSSRLLQKSF
jgi:hypothetical protein